MRDSTADRLIKSAGSMFSDRFGGIWRLSVEWRRLWDGQASMVDLRTRRAYQPAFEDVEFGPLLKMKRTVANCAHAPSVRIGDIIATTHGHFYRREGLNHLRLIYSEHDSYCIGQVVPLDTPSGPFVIFCAREDSMRDMRDAKPGDVYRDRDGDVWGVLHDGRAVPFFLAGGHMNTSARGFDRDDYMLAEHGPFVLLTPEEETEW